MKINKLSWLGRSGVVLFIFGIASLIIMAIEDIGEPLLPLIITAIGASLYVTLGNEFDE